MMFVYGKEIQDKVDLVEHINFFIRKCFEDKRDDNIYIYISGFHK